MMELLAQKVAIVTGGSRGIGRAIVETFAKQGASVVFTATSPVSSEVIDSLNSIGAKYHFMTANASSFSDSEKVVQTCLELYGRIDILVNNAGITRDNLLMRMAES